MMLFIRSDNGSKSRDNYNKVFEPLSLHSCYNSL